MFSLISLNKFLRRNSINNTDRVLYPNIQQFIDKYLKNGDLVVRKRIYKNLDMDVNHKETLELIEQFLPKIMENIQISEHLKHVTNNVLSTKIR